MSQTKTEAFNHISNNMTVHQKLDILRQLRASHIKENKEQVVYLLKLILEEDPVTLLKRISPPLLKLDSDIIAYLATHKNPDVVLPFIEELSAEIVQTYPACLSVILSNNFENTKICSALAKKLDDKIFEPSEAKESVIERLYRHPEAEVGAQLLSYVYNDSSHLSSSIRDRKKENPLVNNAIEALKESDRQAVEKMFGTNEFHI